MREVGVDGLFAAPEFAIQVDDLTIHSHCEKMLLEIELDLGNSVSTFEALQWAIRELERMELQERYSVLESQPDEDEAGVDAAASLARSSSKEEGGTGGTIPEKGSPTKCDPGSKDPVVAARSGIHSERESLDEKLMKWNVDEDASPSGPTYQTEEPPKGDVRNWRHIFKAPSKRKSAEEDSGSEGGKRNKVRKSDSTDSFNMSKKLVLEADHGEAGKRMEERISARLAIPDCIFLTNLVSHCLLVSMDQVPTKTIQEEALASFGLYKRGAADASEGRTGLETLSADQNVTDNTSYGSDWLWLHKWLVKTVLSDVGYERFSSLDWLIAFMAASRQSLIKPILDDLASDLEKRETEGSFTRASYMRRTGVLEYAAFRDPERIFGSLRPLFPPAVFPAEVIECCEYRSQGSNELWHGWLGLMVYCPRLFGAFSRFWIPTLSVEEVKSWRMKFVPSSLYAIWAPQVGTGTEKPKTTREWLRAAVIRRIPELAPVAYDFVVLLSRLDEACADHETNEEVVGFGNYVLTSIYKEISKHILPKVLGGGRDVSTEVLPDVEWLREESGSVAFTENLKQHVHVLWEKALENFSASRCTCCEIPHKEEMQLESSGRTKTGLDDSICVESSGEGSDAKANHEGALEVPNGCLRKDPLIQLCYLTLLCCSDQVVAELLANASLIRSSSGGSFDTQSLSRLVMVMRAMWIVSGQGRGTSILELWAQQMIDRAMSASDEQALQRILAIRQLLDVDFWQSYHALLGQSLQSASATSIEASEDAGGHQGLSWKVVWKGLHKVLDIQWLHILPLMHREWAWELRLAVLKVLELLIADGTTRPQAVADRLKGSLGLFFSWLDIYDGCDDKLVVGQVGEAATMLKRRSTWQCVRAKERLKSIIVELASSSFPSFTLVAATTGQIINSLLDFSFERTGRMPSGPSPSSITGQLSRTELSSCPFRRGGTGSPSSFCMAPLSTGKLDRYGRLELISSAASQGGSSTGLLPVADSQLTEENCRNQSDASSPLQSYEKERMVRFSEPRHAAGQRVASTSATEHLDEDLTGSSVMDAELGSLLHRTFQRACSRSVELLDAWPCHPVNVLATHMADRLETPHEVPMTMEQYEEVLPKHISSLRHIFVTDCFTQNPLLMEMVELIVRHGGNRAVLRCVEFVRVLLADSISRWHGAYRSRWPQRVPQTKVGEVETWNRVQVSRLIQLVASANWLPQPLAASGEIIDVIDGSDIADLLLLVWRCMHHAMAFGCKAWGESSSNLQATAVVAVEGQAISITGSGVDEEAGKEGTYTEWESHFFAILRRNISKIGAHFPQVYPLRKAF